MNEYAAASVGVTPVLWDIRCTNQAATHKNHRKNEVSLAFLLLTLPFWCRWSSLEKP